MTGDLDKIKRDTQLQKVTKAYFNKFIQNKKTKSLYKVVSVSMGEYGNISMDILSAKTPKGKATPISIFEAYEDYEIQ